MFDFLNSIGGSSGGGGGLFDTISGWVGNNKGWLQPVSEAILGGINNSNRSSGRDDIASLLRGQIDRDYSDSKATYDAYLAHQNAVAANSRANAGIAASNAKARQQAQQKANRIQIKGVKEGMKFYEPHKSSFERLFPMMTNTYAGSLSGIDSLLASLQTPEAIARMNQSVPAHMTDIPLPSYLKKEKA